MQNKAHLNGYEIIHWDYSQYFADSVYTPHITAYHLPDVLAVNSGYGILMDLDTMDW